MNLCEINIFRDKSSVIYGSTLTINGASHFFFAKNEVCIEFVPERCLQSKLLDKCIRLHNKGDTCDENMYFWINNDE